MYSRLSLLLFFITSFVFGLIFFVYPVFSQTPEIDTLQKKIQEKRDRVEQLEKSIIEYKEKIKQKQLEAVSLSNQLAILDNRITEVQLDIESAENTMAALQYEIERDSLQIDLKQVSMNKQKQMIGELLRTIHYNDSQSYLEIAANYENFSDFYNQVQYVKSVEGNLYTSLYALRTTKESLEKQRQETEQRKQNYEEVKLSLVEKKGDFKEQVYLKEDLLNQTHASEVTYKTLLSTLKSQHEQIESEIIGIEKEVRKKLAEQDKLKQVEDSGGTLFSWPAPSKYITAQFHDPDYPYRHVFEHSGIDIRAAQGTAVKAAGSGYVARAKRCTSSSCYSFCLVVHANGLSTVYGHMSSLTACKEDQFVTRGDVIGYSGGTPGTAGAGPFVTGAHLHFEVRRNGIPVNPLPYLVAR